ncbi:Kinesin light chain 3 [Irineochytrium annulatum]|nr:Kinesin light chain 3 [Irineochytrium annulatum]
MSILDLDEHGAFTAAAASNSPAAETPESGVTAAGADALASNMLLAVLAGRDMNEVVASVVTSHRQKGNLAEVEPSLPTPPEWNTGSRYRQEGRLTEALTQYTAVLDAQTAGAAALEDEGVLDRLGEQAALYVDMNNPDAAARDVEQCLTCMLQHESIGPSHRMTMSAQLTNARVQLLGGRPEAAVAELKALYTHACELFAASDDFTLSVQRWLATAYLRNGDLDLSRETFTAYITTSNGKHADLVLALEDMAELFIKTREYANAAVTFEGLHKKAVEAEGRGGPKAVGYMYKLAWAKEAAADYADAMAICNELLELPEMDPVVGVDTLRAACLTAKVHARFESSRDVARRVCDKYEPLVGTIDMADGERADISRGFMFVRSMLYYECGEFEAAEKGFKEIAALSLEESEYVGEARVMVLSVYFKMGRYTESAEPFNKWYADKHRDAEVAFVMPAEMPDLASIGRSSSYTEDQDGPSMVSTDPMAMTTLGVRLSFVHDLIEAFGGRDNLRSLKTEDISALFIKPLTQSTQKSFIDTMLLLNRTDVVAESTHFISHAWRYQFIDVVEAIDHFFATQHKLPAHEVVIWFDMFSNSQHNTANKPFHWWETTFMTAVKTIQNVIMVVQPWYDPVPLTRAWCIFEVMAAFETKSNFHVSMTPREAKHFEMAMRFSGDAFFARASDLSCEHAVATNPDDRDKIFQVIYQLTDIPSLNKLVFNSVWGTWMKNTMGIIVESAVVKATDGRGLAAENDRKEDGLSRDAIESMHKVGRELIRQGKYADAEIVFRQIYESARRLLGEGSRDTLESASSLVSVLQFLGRGAEALELAEATVARLSDRGEDDNFPALVMKQQVANACVQKGNFARAEILYVECISGMRRNLHDENAGYNANMRGAKLTEALHGYGVLKFHQQAYDAAEPLFLEVMEMQRNGTVADEPGNAYDAVDLANDLAAVFCQRGENERAEALYIEALASSRRKNGDVHPTTLMLVNGLSGCYRALNRNDEAAPLFTECYENSKKLFGPSHPRTVRALNNCAAFYKALGKWEESEKTYKECIELQIAAAGDDDAQTLKFMQNLATLHIESKELAKAVPILTFLFQKWNTLVGLGDGRTVVVIESLADVYRDLDDLDNAWKYYDLLLSVLFIATGPLSNDTVDVARKVFAIFKGAGRLAKAIEVHVKVLTDDGGPLSRDPDDVLGFPPASRQNFDFKESAIREMLLEVADGYRALGQHAQAADLVERNMLRSHVVLGRYEMATIVAYQDAGRCMLSLDGYEERALKAFEKAFDLSPSIDDSDPKLSSWAKEVDDYPDKVDAYMALIDAAEKAAEAASSLSTDRAAVADANNEISNLVVSEGGSTLAVIDESAVLGPKGSVTAIVDIDNKFSAVVVDETPAVALNTSTDSSTVGTDATAVETSETVDITDNILDETSAPGLADGSGAAAAIVVEVPAQSYSSKVVIGADHTYGVDTSEASDIADIIINETPADLSDNNITAAAVANTVFDNETAASVNGVPTAAITDSIDAAAANADVESAVLDGKVATPNNESKLLDQADEAFNSGDFILAQTLYRDALENFPQPYSDSNSVASGFNNLTFTTAFSRLGTLAKISGDLGAAEGYWLSALECHRAEAAAERSEGEVAVMVDLAKLARVKGDVATSLARYKQVEDALAGLEAPWAMRQLAFVYEETAEEHTENGEPDAARVSLTNCLTILRTLTGASQADIARVLTNLLRLAETAGDDGDSVQRLTELLEVQCGIYGGDAHPNVEQTLGRLVEKMGENTDEAKELLVARLVKVKMELYGVSEREAATEVKGSSGVGSESVIESVVAAASKVAENSFGNAPPPTGQAYQPTVQPPAGHEAAEAAEIDLGGVEAEDGVDGCALVGVDVCVVAAGLAGDLLGVAALGVTFGVAEGVDFGVDIGVTVGVDFGVAVGVDFGVVEGVDFGVVEGVDFGVVVGVDFGVEVGVDFGVADGVAAPPAGNSQLTEEPEPVHTRPGLQDCLIHLEEELHWQKNGLDAPGHWSEPLVHDVEGHEPEVGVVGGDPVPEDVGVAPTVVGVDTVLDVTAGVEPVPGSTGALPLQNVHVTEMCPVVVGPSLLKTDGAMSRPPPQQEPHESTMVAVVVP